jgi:FixJ family two-component response regulator
VNPPGPTVFIVDDDASVREALAGLIRAAGLRAASFPSAREFLRHPPAEGVACLVLDVHLPDVTGLDLQRELETSGRQIPTVFITGRGDIPMSVRAMKAGAVEFLTKPFGDEQLLSAIWQALERDRSEREQRAAIAEIAASYEALTARERQVMALVVEGKLNKQIAGDLGVTEITVKVHRRRIMDKMRASSLADLVRMAERLRRPAQV